MQRRMDFNEAVRQEAYSRNQQGREPWNRRDAARMVSRYQELSRNPTIKNIRAAARIYNALEQNNYHTELRSARRGASSRDVSRVLERERRQRNRRQNERRKQQRAARRTIPGRNSRMLSAEAARAATPAPLRSQGGGGGGSKGNSAQ